MQKGEAYMYKNHIISTKNERLSTNGGFRIPVRPNHDVMDFTDAQRLELKQDIGILAFANGVVTDTIVGNSVGHSVSIAHEGNILTRYFHMKPGSIKVKAGQKVKQGDVIGIMGTSGESTGIHLHFAVKEKSTAYDNGVYINPEPYLTGEKNMPDQPETKNITVTFGSTKYILNGEPFDEPTMVYNDVAYLPAAYLATKLGLSAVWDVTTNTTTLTNKK